MDLYPDAKIILTTRENDDDGDLEGWIQSMQCSIYDILAMKRLSFLAKFDKEYTRPALLFFD
ncbi:uncharacterized protein BDV17DRAFT_260301 [Aspergillus undulatus]|uniref:uncharacterized protein n=1 Tax=Aspergillus undulatus TaxID=1810928 RepID=UPI003CCCC72E